MELLGGFEPPTSSLPIEKDNCSEAQQVTGLAQNIKFCICTFAYGAKNATDVAK